MSQSANAVQLNEQVNIGVEVTKITGESSVNNPGSDTIVVTPAKESDVISLTMWSTAHSHYDEEIPNFILETLGEKSNLNINVMVDSISGQIISIGDTPKKK
jgi:hypothetical protein